MSLRPSLFGVSLLELRKLVGSEDRGEEPELGAGVVGSDADRERAREFIDAIRAGTIRPGSKATEDAFEAVVVMKLVHAAQDEPMVCPEEEWVYSFAELCESLAETPTGDIIQIATGHALGHDEEEIEELSFEGGYAGDDWDDELDDLLPVQRELLEELSFLAHYFIDGRPIFGQRLDSDWGFYAYLNAGEVRLLLDAYEEFPALFEDASMYEFGQTLPEEFFDWLDQIARRGWDLWFEAS